MLLSAIIEENLQRLGLVITSGPSLPGLLLAMPSSANGRVFILFLAAAAIFVSLAEGRPRDPYDIVWRRNVTLPDPASGLDYTFYDDLCPNAEGIVRSRVTFFVSEDSSRAAGLLRLFFLDCFVNGCDASVLLYGSAIRPLDDSVSPHYAASADAFEIVDDIKAHLEEECPGVVSCADIVALAARDAILAANGPYFPITTGRRDSSRADSKEDVKKNMPKSTWDVSQLLKNFKSKGLDVVDLVALSGAHTIGQAHCNSFANRLWSPGGPDPTMRTTLAKKLTRICPSIDSNNQTYLDQRTPSTFDNKYYRDLIKKEGILSSDQNLFSDFRTKELVRLFASSKFTFILQFAASAVRMGHLGVLTGFQGEIRRRCSSPNSAKPPISQAPSPSLSPSPSQGKQAEPASSPPPKPPAPSSPPPAVQSEDALVYYILFLLCSFGILVFTSYYFKAKFADVIDSSILRRSSRSARH